MIQELSFNSMHYSAERHEQFLHSFTWIVVFSETLLCLRFGDLFLEECFASVVDEVEQFCDNLVDRLVAIELAAQ